MADNNKTAMVGKTVYLSEGESFDSVRMPNGTVGSEQPAPSTGATVRASDQSPARRVKTTPSSVVRATAPQPQVQQQPQKAQQAQQPSEQRQFLRASAMPVTVVQDLGDNEPQPQKERTQFLRASSRPIEPGPEVKPEEFQQQPEQPAQQPEAEPEQESPAIAALEMLRNSRQEEPAEEEIQEPGETVPPETREWALETNEEEREERAIMDIPMEDKKIQETAPEAERAEEKRRPKYVDLSKLTVLSKTEIDKERDLRQALFNNKAAFQIVAAQSGYVAKVAPLVHKDMVNLLYGNLSRHEYKRAVYKTVHDKVFDTSVGKMDFDSWLKSTTVEDMETFYYGVYSSTFPNEGTFRFTCPSCGKDHDYKVNHANLIKTTDRDHMRKLIDEVTRNSTTVEKMREYSLIGKNQAIELAQSKLVVELCTPSLQDSLEILRTVPEKTIDKDAVTITNILYINRVLIPSKEGNGYAEESNKTSILRIIDNLSIDDANELQNAVYDRVDENRITYSIKNIKCVDCSHEEKDIPVSLEDILFTLIFEKAQQ